MFSFVNIFKPKKDKLSNFYLIENSDKLHVFLRQYYLDKQFPIDEFNLTGIRFESDQSKDWYNDVIVGWTWDRIVPVIGTTQPGVRYNKTPLPGTTGVAHIEEGFFKECYQLGFHNALKPTKHAAFVQVGNMKYYIDRNKNFYYDESTDARGNGVIATNLHADVYGKQNDGLIGYASAGCQVVQDVVDLNKIIQLFKSTKIYKKNPNTKLNYLLIKASEVNLAS